MSQQNLVSHLARSFSVAGIIKDKGDPNNYFVLVQYFGRWLLYQVGIVGEQHVPEKVCSVECRDESAPQIVANRGAVVCLSSSGLKLRLPGKDKFGEVRSGFDNLFRPDQIFAGVNGFYLVEVNSVYYFEVGSNGADVPQEVLRVNPPEVVTGVVERPEGRDCVQVLVGEEILLLPVH